MQRDTILQRLADAVSPTDDASVRMRKAILRTIEPTALRDLKKSTLPSPNFRTSVRSKVLERIALPNPARVLPALKNAVTLTAEEATKIRSIILARLIPARVPLTPRVLRWTAAFAIVVFAVRLLPFAFVAPSGIAESTVQLVPVSGEVSMSVGGLWVPVVEPTILKNPTMVRTGPGAQATVVYFDDAVFRLGGDTTVRLHDLTDRPAPVPPGPTITILRGTVWTLGLLAPNAHPIDIDLNGAGTLALSEGSIDIDERASSAVASVYDRRASIMRDREEAFLVSGETITFNAQSSLIPTPLPTWKFTTSWVRDNIDRDAVHRKEVLLLEQQRRERLAGILPTSILYPFKRVAEEVDVLFTVGSDARAQKRIEYADTRLNEALTLLDQGEQTQASGSLLEYKQTLLGLASGTGDNLVKFLIKKQLDEASASVAALTPDDERYAIKQAVLQVSAAVPNADLTPDDIEGYVLVDKLASLDRLLAAGSGATERALAAYRDIQPYIGDLLSDDKGVHPLLKKEASSLIVSVSHEMSSLADTDPDNADLQVVKKELEPYLPPEPERILVSEEELDTTVQNIVDRVFVYKMPRSRYNQLTLELKSLESNPNRGMILRRLYHALPANGLALDVENEMKKLSDELKK